MGGSVAIPFLAERYPVEKKMKTIYIALAIIALAILARISENLVQIRKQENPSVEQVIKYIEVLRTNEVVLITEEGYTKGWLAGRLFAETNTLPDSVSRDTSSNFSELIRQQENIEWELRLQNLNQD